MVGAIEVDESRWPLVVIRWPAELISDESIDAFLTRGRAHLARRERFASLHDGVRASGLNGKQRRRMAEHVTENREALARYHAAAAIVAPSSLVRGIITAVNWVAPPPFPQETFATFAQAEAWLRTKLDAPRAT